MFEFKKVYTLGDSFRKGYKEKIFIFKMRRGYWSLLVAVFLFFYLQTSVIAAEPVTLGSASKDVLSTKVDIPPNLEFPARIIFGLIESDKLDLQTFIVLLALWFIVFLLLHTILEIAPIFGEGWKAWLVAFLITDIIAISGAIRLMGLFFFGFGNFFGFISTYPLLRVIFVLLLLIVVFYVLFKLIKIYKNKLELQDMIEAGYDVALERAAARAARKVMKKG